MRLLALGLLTVTLTMAAGVQSGSAQFNNRFCAQGGRGGSGEPDCSYRTWEQCRAAASGTGRYCTENPNWQRARQKRNER